MYKHLVVTRDSLEFAGVYMAEKHLQLRHANDIYNAVRRFPAANPYGINLPSRVVLWSVTEL